jgi:hypothetical protein
MINLKIEMLKLTDLYDLSEHCKVYEKKTDYRPDHAS